MIEEAIAREVSFSVMYTPCVTEVKADKINKIKDLFAKKHPDYVEHIYTGNSRFHMLLSAVYCLRVCVSDSKRVWESLELELQTFLHCCGGN